MINFHTPKAFPIIARGVLIPKKTVILPDETVIHKNKPYPFIQHSIFRIKLKINKRTCVFLLSNNFVNNIIVFSGQIKWRKDLC